MKNEGGQGLDPGWRRLSLMSASNFGRSSRLTMCAADDAAVLRHAPDLRATGARPGGAGRWPISRLMQSSFIVHPRTDSPARRRQRTPRSACRSSSWPRRQFLKRRQELDEAIVSGQHPIDVAVRAATNDVSWKSRFNADGATRTDVLHLVQWNRSSRLSRQTTGIDRDSLIAAFFDLSVKCRRPAFYQVGALPVPVFLLVLAAIILVLGIETQPRVDDDARIDSASPIALRVCRGDRALCGGSLGSKGSG